MVSGKHIFIKSNATFPLLLMEIADWGQRLWMGLPATMVASQTHAATCLSDFIETLQVNGVAFKHYPCWLECFDKQNLLPRETFEKSSTPLLNDIPFLL